MDAFGGVVGCTAVLVHVDRDVLGSDERGVEVDAGVRRLAWVVSRSRLLVRPESLHRVRKLWRGIAERRARVELAGVGDFVLVALEYVPGEVRLVEPDPRGSSQRMRVRRALADLVARGQGDGAGASFALRNGRIRDVLAADEETVVVRAHVLTGVLAVEQENRARRQVDDVHRIGRR